MSFSPYQIVEAKKHGKRLPEQDIVRFVNEYVSGLISDAQMSALAMAVYFNGMDDEETAALTFAMAHSGKTIDTSSIEGLCDKHSTGGVGDKTSFLVVSMLSALGLPVGMMSGRGLGHTGGTIDKLESIEGFECDMPVNDYIATLARGGSAIISQTRDLAPADKRMYALRSQTATIDSIPLIVASIMSKKIASGSQNLVLDVKYGNGAFIEDKDQARKLAAIMADVGKLCGISTVYVLSPMDDVLGRTAGNAVEIAECLDIMSGKATSISQDLVDLSVDLSARLYRMSRPGDDIDAHAAVRKTLADGRALDAFLKMLESQGARIGDDGRPCMVEPDTAVPIVAGSDGMITSLDVKGAGMSIARLGANRIYDGDSINHDIGLIVNAKVGDEVKCGQVIAQVVYNEKNSRGRVEKNLANEVDVLTACWNIAEG